MGLFLLEGMVLGAVGGALGVLLGAAAVKVMARAGIPLPAPGATVPSILHPTVEAAYLLRAMMMATCGAALATLWPAQRASKLRPVEALHRP
jgi:putative ABC transport system permease protein